MDLPFAVLTTGACENPKNGKGPKTDELKNSNVSILMENPSIEKSPSESKVPFELWKEFPSLHPITSMYNMTGSARDKAVVISSKLPNRLLEDLLNKKQNYQDGPLLFLSILILTTLKV